VRSVVFQSSGDGEVLGSVKGCGMMGTFVGYRGYRAMQWTLSIRNEIRGL